MMLTERFKIAFVAAISALLINFAASIATAATAIPYQGHLTDAAGLDLSATVPVEVRIYDSLIAGIGQDISNSHVIYAERHSAVSVAGGLFNLAIGEGSPLDPKWTGLPVDALSEKENVYLELWIDGERLSPRQRMGSTAAAVRAARAIMADSLESLPTIKPEMVPAYDASKITSGQFGAAQVPPLDAGYFTAGKVAPSSLATLPASKFSVGAGKPTLAADRLPHNLDASKIAGGQLPIERFPAGLQLSSNFTFGMGTLANHRMLPFPSGYDPDTQCKYLVTLGNMEASAEDGMDYLGVGLDGSHVLNCDYSAQGDGENHECAANYMYVCKK